MTLLDQTLEKYKSQQRTRNNGNALIAVCVFITHDIHSACPLSQSSVITNAHQIIFHCKGLY